MPCDSRGYAESEARLLRRELDRVTRILCEVFQATEEDLPFSHEALAWKEEHERHDRERRAKEREMEEFRQRKAQALAKLLPEEKRLLGVRED